MPQTITDGAGRQIPLSSILFSTTAANFRPAKSRLITTVRAIAHVTSVQFEIRPAASASTFWKGEDGYVSGTAARALKHFANTEHEYRPETCHLNESVLIGMVQSKVFSKMGTNFASIYRGLAFAMKWAHFPRQ